VEWQCFQKPFTISGTLLISYIFMFISTTILYFQENPVGYELHRADGGFELKPTPNTKSNLIPPTISVAQTSYGWEVQGVKDEDIQQQVIRLVELNEVINLQGKLSAAS
jgi:hypothetical protein